jgi:hypothetical protein
LRSRPLAAGILAAGTLAAGILAAGILAAGILAAAVTLAVAIPAAATLAEMTTTAIGAATYAKSMTTSETQARRAISYHLDVCILATIATAAGNMERFNR